MPFVQNAFFQDYAVAPDGETGIIVASGDHIEANRVKMFSLKEAASFQFYKKPPAPPMPVESDSEIQKTIVVFCSRDSVTTTAAGADIQALEEGLQSLIDRGGSLLRAHALHPAVANNNLETAKLMEPLFKIRAM